MGLTVETPTPPDITNRPLPSDVDPTAVVDGTGDLRRAEVEEFLGDGAWTEAFQEWAEYTDLTEREYRVIHDAGLFEQLDFYWDPTAEGVRFEVPELPATVAEQGDVAERATSELMDLGQTVTEVLEDGYVDWDEPGSGDDSWSEETFDEESPLEE